MFKTRFISMLVLLMTAVTGAWATEPKVYDRGEVELYSLELGDILLPGVTLTKGSYSIDVVTRAERYSVGGQIRSMGTTFGIYPIVIGANGVINNKQNGNNPILDYTPITAEGEVGNAWEVTYVDAPSYRPGYKGITIAGIKYTTGYTVTMKESTEDATSWQGKAGEGAYQSLPLEGVAANTAVSVKYNGTKKVKSVKAKKKAAAPAGPTLDLATVTEATTVEDGYTLTGTLGANVKISIADGATVTLDGVTINGANNGSYSWAGITCLGNATIILSGTNTVKGFYEDYPGIYVPQDKTLTIEGSGSLTASSNGYGCGIGGGYQIACGNIVIAGGTFTATGGGSSAGIGGGKDGSCGDISITGGTINANGGTGAAGIGGGNEGSCRNISITGGTVNATGGQYGAGIGSGNQGQCGTVTITSGVTSVTATKGAEADYSIGAGSGGNCGTVTIGGNTGAIETSPYTYPEAN